MIDDNWFYIIFAVVCAIFTYWVRNLNVNQSNVWTILYAYFALTGLCILVFLYFVYILTGKVDSDSIFDVIFFFSFASYFIYNSVSLYRAITQAPPFTVQVQAFAMAIRQYARQNFGSMSTTNRDGEDAGNDANLHAA